MSTFVLPYAESFREREGLPSLKPTSVVHTVSEAQAAFVTTPNGTSGQRPPPRPARISRPLFPRDAHQRLRRTNGEHARLSSWMKAENAFS